MDLDIIKRAIESIQDVDHSPTPAKIIIDTKYEPALLYGGAIVYLQKTDGSIEIKGFIHDRVSLEALKNALEPYRAEISKDTNHKMYFFNGILIVIE